MFPISWRAVPRSSGNLAFFLPFSRVGENPVRVHTTWSSECACGPDPMAVAAIWSERAWTHVFAGCADWTDLARGAFYRNAPGFTPSFLKNHAAGQNGVKRDCSIISAPRRSL